MVSAKASPPKLGVNRTNANSAAPMRPLAMRISMGRTLANHWAGVRGGGFLRSRFKAGVGVGVIIGSVYVRGKIW